MHPDPDDDNTDTKCGRMSLWCPLVETSVWLAQSHKFLLRTAFSHQLQGKHPPMLRFSKRTHEIGKIGGSEKRDLERSTCRASWCSP